MNYLLLIAVYSFLMGGICYFAWIEKKIPERIHWFVGALGCCGASAMCILGVIGLYFMG